MKTPPTREQLTQAYINTGFVVKTEKARFEIRIGNRSADLDELMEYIGLETACFITAYNPGSSLCAAAQNAAMHKLLLEDLTNGGHDFCGGEGVPDDPNWVPEESVLILGISRIAAIALGEKYGQNAIVFCRLKKVAELLWCVGE